MSQTIDRLKIAQAAQRVINAARAYRDSDETTLDNSLFRLYDALRDYDAVEASLQPVDMPA